MKQLLRVQQQYFIGEPKRRVADLIQFFNK